MRIIAALFAAVLLSQPTHAQTQTITNPSTVEKTVAPVRTLSSQEAREDVKLLRRALETIHPGLYRRQPKRDLDRSFADLEAATSAPVTDVELYRRISLLLASVRCTHTKADQTEAMEAWRKDNPSHLPFRFRIVEGRMLVLSSDPEQSVLPFGAEILSINGRSTANLIDMLGAYVPIDGFTEPSRAAYLAKDGDLMGADFDHFYPYVFGFPHEFTLVLRDNDAAPRRSVVLAPVSFRTWLRLDSAGAPYRQNFADSTSWRMLNDSVGYLRVDTFVNYRKPVDAAALYAQALNELSNAGMRKLILDLRQNGGGSNDASLALIDALATKPYTYQRAIRYRAVRYDDLPNYISSWGDRDALFKPEMERFTQTSASDFALKPNFAPDVLLPRQPASGAFTGPVVVLISPANASGATMVIAKLRDMDRVRLIGERSGGSADGPTAGTIFNVKLPNSGISVRVPLVFNEMDVARFDRRGGVRPDVRVALRIQDFRAKSDPTLFRALSEMEREP